MVEGKIQSVRFCKVESIYDDSDAQRIKVRLAPEDNSKKIEDIPYAFPLLPKMIHIKPKVGEAVLILLTISNDNNSQRYYIGPVISQEQHMFKSNFFGMADTFLRGAFKPLSKALSLEPESKGVMPNDDDVVIRGRKHGEIQITDDDVRIKAGVKLCKDNNPYDITFNTKNPSYGKFKYHTKALTNNTKSTATMVADKICLLSHSSPVNFKLTDRQDLITDKELDNVIKSAYKLPYGEKLVEFLQTFVEAFVNHTHYFAMKQPVETYLTELRSQKAEMLDKKLMLSDTVRIN